MAEHIDREEGLKRLHEIRSVILFAGKGLDCFQTFGAFKQIYASNGSDPTTKLIDDIMIDYMTGSVPTEEIEEKLETLESLVRQLSAESHGWRTKVEETQPNTRDVELS